MSDQVISLTSSDEEDNAEPPLKKPRSTPILPECTVTLVPSPIPMKDAPKTIETVLLDSDDEICEDKDDVLHKTSINSVNIIKKPVDPKNVDLISLTDDEEDNTQPKAKEVINLVENGKQTKKNKVQINQETVSIDDSDTEDLQMTKENDKSTDKSEADIGNTKKNKGKSNHSIIIDDSDDETEKENHCENESIDTFPVKIKKTSASDIASASTSKDDSAEAKTLFKQFIRIVEEKIVDSQFEEILPKKVPIIKKYFNRSGTYIKNTAFKTLLMDSIECMRNSSTAKAANSAVLAFHKVFEHLKSHMAETTIVVEKEHLPKIKKLEHTIKLLRNRIHQLENAEVNFDDDEDSAYIMLDRYQCRLKKVYAKYCQYINRNPHSGRATYDRITFVNSSYNEINQSLTKKYKNSLVFPSYFDLESFITKVVKREKMNLSEADIKIESKKCFKVLGNILQKKRRQELYDSHLDFVESSDDPATKDISLENVLKKNYTEGKIKIEKLYQKYVNKQEKGEDQVSTDEDCSSEESNAEDNEVKKGKAKKIGNVNVKRKGNSIVEKKDNGQKETHDQDKVENEDNQEGKNEKHKEKNEKSEKHEARDVENDRENKKDIQDGKKEKHEIKNGISDENCKKQEDGDVQNNQENKKDIQKGKNGILHQSPKKQEDREVQNDPENKKNIEKEKIEFLTALNMQVENRTNKGNILNDKIDD